MSAPLLVILSSLLLSTTEVRPPLSDTLVLHAHKEENKYLKCGKLRYIEVINDDGETVTTEVVHKQLRYMPIAPRLK
jgi:hypothetical protein